MALEIDPSIPPVPGVSPISGETREPTSTTVEHPDYTPEQTKQLMSVGHGSFFGSCGHRMGGCLCSKHANNPALSRIVDEKCEGCMSGQNCSGGDKGDVYCLSMSDAAGSEVTSDKIPAGSRLTPADLPPMVGNQPARYFKKALARVGDFEHPIRHFIMSVNKPRIENWSKHVRGMLDAGWRIPLQVDHRPGAGNSVGKLLDAWPEDNFLMGMCQAIGNNEANLISKNDSSVGVHTDWTDPKGRHWGDVIQHIGVTEDPVMSGLGEFQQLASQGDNTQPIVYPEVYRYNLSQSGDSHMSDMMLPCSAANHAEMCSMAPNLAGAPVQEIVPRVTQHMATVHGHLMKLSGIPMEKAQRMSMSELMTAYEARHAETEKITADYGKVSEQLIAKDRQLQEMSGKIVKPLDDDTRAAIGEAVRTKASLCVARGALTPTVANSLIAWAIGSDSNPNELMMSRAAAGAGANKAAALELFDRLMDNKPVELQEMSGAQVGHRNVPGAEAPSEKEKVTAMMIDMANKGKKTVAA